MTERLHREPLLWLVAIGFFMQTLDATVVNTALPAMAVSLGERPLAMQSVVIAYTLSMALLIPASGWIADRFGTRATYTGALLLFGLASALCALSTSLPALAAARLLQGCGGAMLLPVGRLAVLRAFPPPRFLGAMSFVTIPGLVGPLVGPLLGGWLVVIASWHWIFWINVPIALLGCLATWRYMPASAGARRVPFDAPGFMLIGVGMAAVTLSLQGLSELHLPGLVVAALGAVGVVAFITYWHYSRRVVAPLFTPAIFNVPSFSIGLAGNLATRLGSGGMPFLVPLTLQVALGYSPVRSGLALVPVALAAMTAKRTVVLLITRLGFRRVLIGNTVLIGAIIATFAFLSAAEPPAIQVLQFALYGAANSMQFSAMNSLVLKDLGPAQTGEGNAMLSMTQMLAMGLGVAVGAALLGVFLRLTGGQPADLAAFRLTFVALGALTALSAVVYRRLEDDGESTRN